MNIRGSVHPDLDTHMSSLVTTETDTIIEPDERDE